MNDPNAIFQKGPDKKRVVIVDDSESMRMVLTRFLVNKGWEVAAFSNGEELLDNFEPGRFNLCSVTFKRGHGNVKQDRLL